jgi:hypothetical protein
MKGAFRFILFGGAVLVLGLMIRSCNKQFGWYEANSIDLSVEGPMEESKFRWYQVDDFQRLDDGMISLPITYGQLLYDTALVKPFPLIQDENKFVLVYDSIWVFPFIHYKLRAQTQHSYEFQLRMKDAVPYVDIVIDGPHYSSYEGKFTSLSDSIAYLPNEGPYYDEEIEAAEDVIKEEEPKVETESGDVTSDPGSTTDHDAR